MQLFDTHAHLLDDQFDLDRNALIASLPEAGVSGFVEACVEAEDIPKIQALTLLYDFVYGSAGIHPHAASKADNTNLLRVERALAQKKIVAVGEIGLDYHYDFSPREAQREALSNQLDLAIAAKKPVIIHDREAHGDVMAMLSARKGRLGGVLHCYSGSYEDAVKYIDMGYYIAFGGALTFKNATKQRAIAEKLPLSRLLIETDCPYMTPEPHRGERNSPLLIHLTLEMLAKVRGISIEEAANAVNQNATDLFGISL
ncbi:MAG: TatD family hydrolase [Eubacteriales bacterium]|jgi:TatD DNase family protein|nr:TatD family hydrolase [Eubacteriales bacterium]